MKAVTTTLPSDAQSRTGVLLMLSSVVFFTSSNLLVRYLTTDLKVDAWTATTFRGLIGLAIVCALYLPTGSFQPKHLLTNATLIHRGLAGGVGIGLFYLAIAKIGAGMATIITMTYPIFGALFALVFLGEALKRSFFLWMSLCYAGLTLLIAPAIQANSEIHFGYYLLAILSAVVAGIVVVLIRLLTRTEHASTIFASQCVFGIVLTAPLAFYHEPNISLQAMLLLILASSLVAFGQLAITQGYRYLSVAKGSSLHCVTPIATLLGASLFFGEQFSGLQVLGSLLVLYACWRLSRA